MEPRQMQETLKGWLSETVKDFVLTGVDLEGEAKEAGYLVGKDPERISERYSACFYTGENRYDISAHRRDDGRTYLGCVAQSRKSRAGEDWFRGNDLPDGEFTRETWDAITRAVVRYETVDIHARPGDDLSEKRGRPGDLERICNVVVGTNFVRIDECPDEVSERQFILLTAMPFAKPLRFDEIFALCIERSRRISQMGGSLVSDIRPMDLLIEILRQATRLRIHMFMDEEDPSEEIEKAKSRIEVCQANDEASLTPRPLV